MHPLVAQLAAHQRLHVARVGGGVVVVVGRQPGVAEAAQVGHDHLEAGLRQRLDVAPPDPLRLGPAVDQEERLAALALADVGDLRCSSRSVRRIEAGHGAQSMTADNLTGDGGQALRPQPIEAKWQRVWADEHTWEVSNEPDERPKAYVLEMLPYPSGEPHIGHLKTYSVGDAVAHFRRRNGYRVLHPMGYDAFGLPAENHAIKTGPAPARVHRGVDRRVPAPVPRVGDLDRLDARVRHARARVLPLDPVDLPAPVRARPRLPQGGGGQVVPQRPDRPGQRAGDRRPLRALRRAGRGAPARAVVLPDHRVRRPAARRHARRSSGRRT